MPTSSGHDYEAIVIGAGVAGIYQIKRLVDLGIDATLLDAAPDLGGTWYWNRYPGARFDSESYTYGYSFSRELLDEWHWKERFSSQPENLRYLNFVADKFDLLAAPYALRLQGRGDALGRGRELLAPRPRRRRLRDLPVRDPDGRPALGADSAALRRDGPFRGLARSTPSTGRTRGSSSPEGSASGSSAPAPPRSR